MKAAGGRIRLFSKFIKQQMLQQKSGMYIGFRPIHHLFEEEAWQLMTLTSIELHPCYTIYGVSRCSCKFCIFLSPKEMKRISESFPEQFKELELMELQLGHTMKYSKDKGTITLKQLIADADKDEQISLDLFKPCFMID